MKVITRFAPSPTGLLHVGNVRTALINYLFTKHSNGKFILRIDDTDLIRSKKEYEEEIKKDLMWLGIEWDETFNQSDQDRNKRYEEVKNELIAKGFLYPCYETNEELEIKRKSLLKRNMPPIYDRSSLKLTSVEKEKLESSGIKPHWRFMLNKEPIKWNDLIRGEIVFKELSFSDPILIREDGTMTYIFTSCVDDIDTNITHIIRGEDHISNSAIQVQILKAIGAVKLPEFAHLCLLGNKEKEISKRIGGFDIKSLMENGILPMAINSFLAKIGTSDSIEYRYYMDNLIQEFDFKKFGKSVVQYEILELERLNSKMIHNMEYEDALFYLNKANLTYIDKSFWYLARGNINKIEEINEWWNLCYSDIKPHITDIKFTSLVAEILLEMCKKDELTEQDWDNWIHEVKTRTQRSGKDLFMPIRLAITGTESGIELKKLFTLLGRQKVYHRLSGISKPKLP